VSHSNTTTFNFSEIYVGDINAFKYENLVLGQVSSMVRSRIVLFPKSMP